LYSIGWKFPVYKPIPWPISATTASLTGILTGIKRWNECGDAQFEDIRSGKPMSGTFEAEAERLAGDQPQGRSQVARIKTSNAFEK
jgi:hypothetical protein